MCMYYIHPCILLRDRVSSNPLQRQIPIQLCNSTMVYITISGSRRLVFSVIGKPSSSEGVSNFVTMSIRKRMTSYRPWGSTDDGTIEFESLTNETLDGALTVMREAFFTDENVGIGVDLIAERGASEELEELCMDAIGDGASVVAIDVATGEVVGAALNKIQIIGDPSAKGSFELFSERCELKSSKALVDFMINVDSRLDLFAHYNVDCLLEIMFMATKRSHRKRRIGELLVVSSIEIARELNRGNNVKTLVEVDELEAINNHERIPSLVSMIATSNYTKKIADRLGFCTLVEASYDEFTFNGKKFSERIGNLHKFTWLVAKRLTNNDSR